MKRYFMISYLGVKKENDGFVNGDTRISSARFPSRKEVVEYLEKYEVINPCIISIYEFKNEQDYNDWCG